MIDRLYGALDDRLGIARIFRHELGKPFPSHWSFLLGEVALYSFVVLVLTGLFLTFFFEPSTEEVVYSGAYAPLRGVEMSQAYRSVLELSFSVRAGLVMRQIHHWAALVFVAAIVVHMARIFFTGAFRKPRELNWIIGTTMLILAIGNGFLGYSLLDDLLSGTGLRIGYSIVLSIPVVGEWITFLLFGGEFPTAETIPRFYAMHIFLLPALLAVLISAHLAIIWHQKHTQFPGAGRTETRVMGTRLWPTYAAKSVGLFFLVTAALALLGGLVQINPVWLYGPFDPAAVSSPAQPDWYVGWVEGAMRLAPPWSLTVADRLVPEIFVPTILMPLVTFLGIYLWPFIEARFTGDHEEHELLDRPSERPVRTGIGVGVLTFYVILFLAGSDDVLALSTGAQIINLVWVLRISALTLPVATGWFTYRILR